MVKKEVVTKIFISERGEDFTRVA